MKNTIALAIIAIFVFSLIPLSFADESGADVNAETAVSIQTTASPSTQDSNANAGAGVRGRIAVREELRKKNKDRLQKIADLDKTQIERLSRLEVKNIDKIAELKKERLEKLAKLSEEKISRLAELDKERLEKISDLSDEELNKIAILGRARLKNLTKENFAELRAELKEIKIMKIKNVFGLNERRISEANIAHIRDRFERAKENFEKAKDDLKEAKEKLKDAREKGNKNETLEFARNYLLHTSDALINHLEKIKTKVQESQNIPDDTEAKIVAEIDAQITDLNAIKADISAATTKEQIKEAAKKLKAKWNRLKHLIDLHAERVVAARVKGIVNQGIVLEKRLDLILQKAKDKNITIDVSADVTQFSEKIAAAKDKYQQAQAKLSSIIDLKLGNATNEQIKAVADEAKELLKQARDSIKEAHNVLKTIVRKIKEADHSADLSEETEVEIAEETSADSSTDEANITTETDTTASADDNASAST